MNQPIQKSYRDWNTGWPENSWEVTEPAISYQSAYLRLLASFSEEDVVSIGERSGGSDHRTYSNVRIESTAPNPFTRSSRIVLDLVQSTHIDLAIFDTRGRRVSLLIDQTLSAGRHRLAWRGSTSDGRRVAAGNYYLRLTDGEATQIRKISLIR
jgi:hypothetical protein